ncbi:sugar ABC transporter permease [Spirochaetia bacterium]|nr:sugar ABC transporter permease [Spirochaetia bacterium]
MSTEALKPRLSRMNARKREGYIMFLMILPLLFLVFLFAYFPLQGWLYAFYDYRPPFKLFDTEFVGFHWFINLFTNASKRKQIFNVMINTFAMSGLSILFSWLPMAFAIFLNFIGHAPFKRVVQTFTTMPNFISWVLVYTMAFFMFNSTGLMNGIAMKLGIINEPILFLQQNNHVWLSMWFWGTWKGLGWSAIMYIAAITGIDQELYDAAAVDGAGRFRQMWHITVPGLLPTYFVLLLLNIANFLNNGFEQYYVFSNAFNRIKIEVLDLFVYNLGIGQGSYSLAVAISMMKSAVSLTLLFTVNKMSKLFRGESII